jgi:hypothetical protein
MLHNEENVVKICKEDAAGLHKSLRLMGESYGGQEEQKSSVLPMGKPYGKREKTECDE